MEPIVSTETAGPAPLSSTERAAYGAISPEELWSFLDAWATRRLGSGIGRVRFRAGRIDVVWGVELADGRAVVIKTHRPPVDLEAVRLACDARTVLAGAGYPCAAPLAGPDEVDGRVLTAETLIEGDTPDGRDPAMRLLLADGLAGHIEILRTRADLVRRAGLGPSWCRYQAGPWPVPHDTIVDFRATPAGYEWLDAFGQRCTDQILANRDAANVVVGHADWYAGNTAVSAEAEALPGASSRSATTSARSGATTASSVRKLVGTFDWELVADTEAVIAGFAAACYASSATGGGGLSTPEEVALFLTDYDTGLDQPLSEPERRTAAGAAAWILAFNARWQVGLIEHGLCDEATVDLVRDRGSDYLALDW